MPTNFQPTKRHHPEHTVALLSDNYFRSDFTRGEWTARYTRDPAMREDRLIPVVVGPVSRANLLDPILHADLSLARCPRASLVDQ